MKAVQREREEKLARKLKDFLYQYIRGDKDGFLNRAKAEAERLSHASESGSRLIAYALYLVFESQVNYSNGGIITRKKDKFIFCVDLSITGLISYP